MKNDTLQIKIKECAIKMGNNIMHIRMSKGISLPAVSSALNTPVYVLKNIEEGKYPDVKVELLIRLVKYYEIKMKDLFEGM